MSRVKAQCPSCAAEVKFRVGTSLVAVCEFCRTVVARGDRAIEDLGKVAELVDTQSPLQLGLKGKYDGRSFVIVGRCQFSHEAGGIWDEWYCAFNNKRWGWLAEAQGRFYLTFEWEPPAGMTLPDKSELVAGRRLRIGKDTHVTVAEVGTAKSAGAEGELPFELKPGESHSFVDLAGANGEFGTFDYGETPPKAYIGREVTLDDLGISDQVKAPEREAKQVASLAVSCPQCGGALELRAPDQTQRVVCPYCASMLDCDKGELRYLSTLQAKGPEPIIPLGTKGTLRGVEYTVLGFVRRAVTYEGLDYFWSEYLLYQPRVGFRWLVHSDDHWNFVEPLSAGEIHVEPTKLTWKGKTFKIFQRGTATVRYVRGEFYWKVTVGEQVVSADYICPPEMISIEDSVQFFEDQGSVGSERNVSLGTYLPVADVEKAFGVSGLPRSWMVAPNQPYPWSGIYKDAAVAVGVMFLLGMLFIGLSSPQEVYRRSFTIPPKGGIAITPAGQRPIVEFPAGTNAASADNPLVPQAVPPSQPDPAGIPPASPPVETAVFFTEKPLELHSRKPIEVTLTTSVQNSWVYVEGDFFNEESGLVQTFSIPVEYYSGVEGGESWSEGSRSSSTIMSALPAGKYMLRLETQSGSTTPETVTVVVEEGAFRLANFLLALMAVITIPILVAVRHWLFDVARWKNSDYSPYQSHGSDDDDE